MKYWKKINIKRKEYVDILKEINSWEEVCCNGRDETIDELSETVYPEIVDFMVEDGYKAEKVYAVMQNRIGGDTKEWKRYL